VALVPAGQRKRPARSRAFVLALVAEYPAGVSPLGIVSRPRRVTALSVSESVAGRAVRRSTTSLAGKRRLRSFSNRRTLRASLSVGPTAAAAKAARRDGRQRRSATRVGAHQGPYQAPASLLAGAWRLRAHAVTTRPDTTANHHKRHRRPAMNTFVALVAYLMLIAILALARP
jgi:hypothetical protein